VTPFYNWRVRDTISHMVTIDRLARLSMGEPEQFAIELARFAEGIKPTDPAAPRTDVFRRIAAYETSRLDILSFRQLLAAWEVGLAELGEVAKANSDNPKVSWFGAPMRLGTLLNARQMEVSGYGQDVFDLCRVERPEGDRLRNVAEFAVRTFSFNFSNRGLPAPADRPRLSLEAPSGATWVWNEGSTEGWIEGSAVDFCLVATQRRNAADTRLRHAGPTAETWLRIAQCIAGPPLDGPAPGERALS